MNKIIKTLTLLFFIGGISLFVAYSSGCFGIKKELVVDPSLELSTADEAVIAAEVDSLIHLLFRMSDLDLNQNVWMEYKKIKKRLSLLEIILQQRDSSDIDIIDFYKPDADESQLDLSELLMVDKDVIQAEIDSLKRHRLRMSGSKTVVIGMNMENKLIDKRIKLLENILNQRQ